MRGMAAEPGEPDPGGAGCFLCDAAATPVDDPRFAEQHGVARTDDAVVLMNRYPYANGHLLIAPADHVCSLGDLSAGTRAALMDLAATAEAVLREAVHAQGCNVGMNIGRCAGAAVPGHLHLHVVPRWSGDVNFMTTIAEARVIPESLDAAYAAIRAAWPASTNA